MGYRLLALAVAALSLAQAKVTSVSGVSYFDSSASTIYAGMAGDVVTVCANTSSDEVCNTCADTTPTALVPCNQSSVHSNLMMKMSFESSQDVTGAIKLLLVSNSVSTELDSISGGLSKNTTAVLEARWLDICANISFAACNPAALASGDATYSFSMSIVTDVDNNSTIETNETKTVPVKFHVINTMDAGSPSIFQQNFGGEQWGFDYYELYPADGRLGFVAQGAVTTRPSGSPELASVMFYAFPQSTDTTVVLTGVKTATGILTEIPLSDTTNIVIPDGSYVQGLKNDQPYCVFAGQKNRAQNIFGFTTAGGLDANLMCGTPTEILGLVNQKKCFVSTVAFGSDMAREVKILRQFRDRVLLSTRWGTAFVRWYYTNGPVAADFIAQSDSLRAVTRALLYPFVGLAWLGVNGGSALAYSVFVLFIVLGLCLILALPRIFGARRRRQEALRARVGS
jgi:hypothetical protein